MTRETSTIQQAWFVLGGEGERLSLAQEGSQERLRCASVLKPLLFWAAGGLEPFGSESVRWKRLAMEAVTVSANGPTVEMWDACGGRSLLDALAAKTDVVVQLAPGGSRAFGRVLVAASDVSQAYARLAGSEERVPGRLLAWMREVPDRQTFGVRPAIARQLDVPPSSVAVKCGWFCDSDETRLRTQVVTVTTTPIAVVGTVVLTAIPIDESTRRTYADTYREGDEVLGVHERVAGATLRAATEAAAARGKRA
jgi:hypothetical protein